MPFHFTAKFLLKAYGYDISGEIYEGTGPIAQQQNLNDKAEPQDHHETPRNINNMMLDAEAEEEFPELQGRGRQKILAPRQK